MRNIRLFKNVAFAAATTIIAATPLITTSCHQSNLNLDSIKIDLPQETFSVGYSKTFVSKTPIDVICLNKQKETIDVETTFVLTNDNDELIQWVWVDHNNKINIKADIQPGKYQFNIYAQNKKKTIKSKVKNFSVLVYQEKTTPTHIDVISPETKQYVFISQQGNINLDIKPSKPGYEEFELNKECNWEITNLNELPLDLNNHPLFKIKNEVTEKANQGKEWRFYTDEEKYYTFDCEKW